MILDTEHLFYKDFYTQLESSIQREKEESNARKTKIIYGSSQKSNKPQLIFQTKKQFPPARYVTDKENGK